MHAQFYDTGTTVKTKLSKQDVNEKLIILGET